MNEQEEWCLVMNKQKNKKKNQSIASDDKEEILELNLNIDVTDSGENINLPNEYVLWVHDIYNKDWNLEAYNKLCKITTVSSFWKLFNNMQNMGYRANNFFLMKNNISPIWEDENNRNGGICSFKINIDQSLSIYEDLCSRMVCNVLVNDIDDINGISFSPKNNWAIIKIWNKNKSNDLSKTLNPEILEKYKDCSIKYKQNEPEY